jgi:hypothetical protein
LTQLLPRTIDGRMRKAEKRSEFAQRILRWHARTFTPRLMRAPVGRGPDFLCIGLQKGGTQWLYDQLRPHPDFWMPPIKEIRYFSLPPEQRDNLRRVRGHWDKLKHWNPRDLSYLAAANWISWREANFEEYARLFNPKGRKIAGDINPEYSIADETLTEQFARRFPSLRIVMLVRDPVARFWSGFSMGVRYGWYPPVKSDEDWPQVEAVANDPYVRSLSLPSEIAARWSKFLPKDQFRVLFYDELATDPVKVRTEVLNFLGADPTKRSGNRPASYNRKASLEKQTMTPFMRDKLAGHFANELKACAAMFGGPAASWPAKYGL